LSGVCTAHTVIFLLRSCSSASVRSSGCFPAQGLVFPVDFWFWFYNLARPDFLCLSHIFVYATIVLCASLFFIAKVSRSRIPVPVSRCTERFADLYLPFDFQLSYSSNRSKHLVDYVRFSVSVASRPSPIVFSARFAPARRRLCLLPSSRLWFSSAHNPFPILSQPIFLFGLVSRCIGQEHVLSGLDFTIGFWFRSNCSVFAPHSGMSFCSRVGLADLGFPHCPFSFSW
jgi:hypothetical protein